MHSYGAAEGEQSEQRAVFKPRLFDLLVVLQVNKFLGFLFCIFKIDISMSTFLHCCGHWRKGKCLVQWLIRKVEGGKES